MKNVNNQIIKDLSAAYKRENKRKQEYLKGIGDIKLEDFKTACRIVDRIEEEIENLEDPYRIIIRNDVVEDKKDLNYLNYFSSTTYYRNRKEAYQMFIDNLNWKK